MAGAAKWLGLPGLLVLAGCAGSVGPGWTYKTAAQSGAVLPMAVWGPPESASDAGFMCRADGGLTFWLGADAALTDGRPVLLRVGRAQALLMERFVEDGVGMAEFAIPAASPLLVALRAGAGRIAWRLPGDQWRGLRLAGAVQRLARACG